jgi:hypothetical protein
MNQEPIEESKHLDEPRPKSRRVLPVITNIGIILLFFCTFMQVKSCSGEYHSVSGMKLVEDSFEQFFRKPEAAILMSPIPIALGSAILSLIFCFGKAENLEKRTSISGIVGGLCISFFIGTCLLLGIKISLPPFLVAGLHFSNPIARYLRNRTESAPLK